TEPDNPGWLRPSINRAAGYAWFARQDRQSYNRRSCRRLVSARSCPFLLNGLFGSRRWPTQLADQIQFGLEIHVVRQLQMRNKTTRLNVVAVHKDKFFLLGGRFDVFAVFIGPQGTVNQRHAHSLALGVAEGQAVAPRKLRRLVFAADELI